MLPELVDGDIMESPLDLLVLDVWPAAMFADKSIKVVNLVVKVGMAPDSGSPSKKAVRESRESDTTSSSSSFSSSFASYGRTCTCLRLCGGWQAAGRG